MANVHLTNLSHKLSNEPELQQYDEALFGMETEGIIEEVSVCYDNAYPVFYMPHRPVVREANVNAKVRPVFDTSSQGYDGIYLNGCMETGPNNLASIKALVFCHHSWYH